MKKPAVFLSEDNKSLVLLDQTLLPAQEKYIYLNTKEELFEAIKKLRVRGAPAIGIAAAYGMYVLTKDIKKDFFVEFRRLKEYIARSRPTAVNLFWALDRMEICLEKEKGKDLEDIKEALREEADKIRDEDKRVCLSIGENTLTMLRPNMGLLTHCNAGGLATSGYGTALSPIFLGNERGYDFRVYADETRPLLQGSRLTVWELMKESIDVTLICDSTAATVMKNGWIDAVLVGCDRVAMNGDTANKIGTLGVAILAKEYGIPFYVCCPNSTIDPSARSGDEIEIEKRNGEEIYKDLFVRQMAPDGTKAFNPAFDLTDNRYISAIITEDGIIYPPYDENISKMRRVHGRKK